MIECMLTSKRCFFEDSVWDPVFESLVDDRPESRQTINLWNLKRYIPGLVAEATKVVCEHRDIGSEDLNDLIARLSHLEEHYLDWRVNFENFLQTKTGEQIPMSTRYELHAVFLVGIILLRRVRATLSSQARAEDGQTANIALHLLAMEGKVSVNTALKSLFLPQKSKIALAIFATTEQWQASSRLSRTGIGSHHSEIIEEKLFSDWCAL